MSSNFVNLILKAFYLIGREIKLQQQQIRSSIAKKDRNG